MLTIAKSLLDQIYAHLEAGYPNEACGILIGEVTYDGATPESGIQSSPSVRTATKVVKDLFLVANVWTVESAREGLRNRYLIAPEDVARADREAGKRGLDIVGFFHSHPDSPSRPSETDREYAWPVVSFIIVTVQQRRVATTNSWVLRDDRTQFDEEPVTVV